MQELHDKEYLIYEPSFNPLKGSTIRMIDFGSDDEIKKRDRTSPKSGQVDGQLQDKLHTGNETTAGQALVPYINNTNSKNISKYKNQSNHLHTQTNKNYEEPL